jgi:hypothetical protein
VAKIEEKISRKLIYLLIFYIWRIKSVINAEDIRLKKIDLKDENKDINVIFVDMFFKTIQGQEKIPCYGKISVNENKLINNYLSNIK